MTITDNHAKPPNMENRSLPARFLNAEQIAMIEEALASLGESGEVRLVVEKGRLRFFCHPEKLRYPEVAAWHDPNQWRINSWVLLPFPVYPGCLHDNSMVCLTV